MFGTLGTIFLIFSLVLGGSGVTVAAAQASMPDDVLYPVKTWSETVRAQFAEQEQARFALALELANRRAEEMQAMLRNGEAAPEAVQSRWQGEMDLALKLAAGQPDDAMVRSLQQIREQLQNQARAFAGFGPQEDALLKQVQEKLRERLQWCEDGLQDPQHLRERLRERNAQGEQGKGPSPAEDPGKGPGPTEDKGYGPGDGTGTGIGPEDGTGDGPGSAGDHNGYGPGDGTGTGIGPEDGTGYGPGDGVCDGCGAGVSPGNDDDHGYGPGDGTGIGDGLQDGPQDGPQDGTGYGPGGSGDNPGYGPGDGTGMGDGPEDGTGYGPGDGVCDGCGMGPGGGGSNSGEMGGGGSSGGGGMGGRGGR